LKTERDSHNELKYLAKCIELCSDSVTRRNKRLNIPSLSITRETKDFVDSTAFGNYRLLFRDSIGNEGIKAPGTIKCHAPRVKRVNSTFSPVAIRTEAKGH
jgi:hypothetical protein